METKHQSHIAVKDASLHFGIMGALTALVFILIFQEDWVGRYQYLLFLIPLPVISLIVARKFPLFGGLLLQALGIGAAVFDVYFTPSHPGQITGRGLPYTLLFVTIPLIASGILHLILWRKNR